MAFPTYSACFFQGIIPTGTTEQVFVPGGLIWVIRDICYFAVPSTVAGIIDVTDEFARQLFWHMTPAATPDFQHLELRQVITDSFKATYTGTGSSCSLRVSGYALNAP